MSREKLRELAQQMAVHMGVEREKPQLHVVGAKSGKKVTARPGSMDPITRLSHVRMIRHLSRIYKLQVLVDQATFGLGSIEDLPDEALKALHKDLDTAIEEGRNGIPLEDTGLIRTNHLEALG